MQVQDTVDRATVKRIERGLRLYALGHVKQHGDSYVVQSVDSSRYYTVSLNNINGECCECEDWRQHGFGHSCKHI